MTGKTSIEAHLLRDEAVELAHLLVVAAEESEEAGLRAGRALRAAERRASSRPMFEFLQVEDEIVTPQARPLADGRELSRLEVREAERRFVLPLSREQSERDR